MERKIKADSNLIIIVGNYGSGKTEVSVNFAKYLSANGHDNVKVVDLDIVNPYFRSREAREDLEKLGVEVISPKGDQHYGESPVISPRIKAEIINGASLLILDVGGDDVGARILSSLFDVISDKKYEFLVVLNANRPFTEDPDGCLKMIEGIERASRLAMTGIISNTHLIESTTMETITDGLKIAQEVSAKKGIGIKFVTLDRKIFGADIGKDLNFPVLPIDRLMLKPWEVKPGKGKIRGL